MRGCRLEKTGGVFDEYEAAIEEERWAARCKSRLNRGSLRLGCYEVVDNESVLAQLSSVISSRQTRGARMPPNPLAEFATLEAHRLEDLWIPEPGLHTPLSVYAK